MNPCYVWDFTLPADAITKDELIDTLRPLCKEWTFQLEMGSKTGYRHFQGRISLKEKQRLTGLKKSFPAATHLSVTSKDGCKDYDYVSKENTRIEGPWTSWDAPVPRQIQGITLRPWQQQVVDSAMTFDARSIDVIIDTEGCLGKSTLKTFVGVHKHGKAIPFCNDYKDMLRMVYDMPKQRLYIIDMPRSISKDRLNQFWSAIETIKDGYAYDDRYHFKDCYFDAPRIWVFTNTMPEASMLSRDRWNFWEIPNPRGNLQALAL